MKNWKTTVGGIVAALGVVCAAQDSPIMHLVGTVLAAVGVFLTGALGTDSTTAK